MPDARCLAGIRHFNALTSWRSHAAGVSEAFCPTTWGSTLSTRARTSLYRARSKRESEVYSSPPADDVVSHSTPPLPLVSRHSSRPRRARASTDDWCRDRTSRHLASVRTVLSAPAFNDKNGIANHSSPVPRRINQQVRAARQRNAIREGNAMRRFNRSTGGPRFVRES